MADEGKQIPEAWRVEKVERDEEGPLKVVLTPIYYGPDEDGPKVGDVLRLEKDPMPEAS
jgi:hypothetical protein